MVGGWENPQLIQKTDGILGYVAAWSVENSFSSKFERQFSSRSEVKQITMVPIFIFFGIRKNKCNFKKKIGGQCAGNVRHVILTKMKQCSGEQRMMSEYASQTFS